MPCTAMRIKTGLRVIVIWWQSWNTLASDKMINRDNNCVLYVYTNNNKNIALLWLYRSLPKTDWNCPGRLCNDDVVSRQDVPILSSPDIIIKNRNIISVVFEEVDTRLEFWLAGPAPDSLQAPIIDLYNKWLFNVTFDIDWQ